MANTFSSCQQQKSLNITSFNMHKHRAGMVRRWPPVTFSCIIPDRPGNKNGGAICALLSCKLADCSIIQFLYLYGYCISRVARSGRSQLNVSTRRRAKQQQAKICSCCLNIIFDPFFLNKMGTKINIRISSKIKRAHNQKFETLNE